MLSLRVYHSRAFICFFSLILVILFPHYYGVRLTLAYSVRNNNPQNNNNPSLDQVGTTKNVATQVLQGVGPCPAEHLNTFNLYDDDDSNSLEEIANQWSANWVQKVDENKAKLVLKCQNEKELFVDRVQVTFPRVPDAGLGLELQEIAGGRLDGIGITIITKIVEDGAAQNVDLVPGDSITEIAVVRRQQEQQLQQNQEVISVNTECLGYEATVDAITGQLPPPLVTTQGSTMEESWQLTVKRLRRKPVVTVHLQYPPQQEEEQESSIQLFAGENLRQGLLARGICLNDPTVQRFDTKPSGSHCGAGGLCRTCRVVVVRDDQQLLNPPRKAEQQQIEHGDNARYRLSCKAIVGYGMKQGNVTLRVYPNQW